jgi:hypothetical protein
MLTVGG